MHDCWEKEENKLKQPINFRLRTNTRSSEQGNVNVEENSGGIELLLTCLDLPGEAYSDCLVDCNVALNGLELMAADIGNAYLEAHTKEKVYCIAGSKFGELAGHVLVFNKALYGLRTCSGLSLCAVLTLPMLLWR